MQEKASVVAMYGGSLTAVIGGLSLSDWGVVIGIVLGVLGFVYNVYHTTKLRKIAEKKGVTISKENEE